MTPRSTIPREQIAGVRHDADRDRLARVARRQRAIDRGIDLLDQLVAVAVLDAPGDPVAVDLRRQHHALVHRRGQRLRAAHAAEPAGDDQLSLQRRRSVVLPRRLGERLVRALQDPLRPDVDPAARRHLAEHDQPLGLQPTELLPRRPVGDEVAVRDEDARRVLVRPEHADRLAGLDQQRLVGRQRSQRAQDRVERLDGPRGLPGTAVHDQPLGVFRHLRIEVVLQHPVGGLDLPRRTAQLGAARRTNRKLDRHEPVPFLVAGNPGELPSDLLDRGEPARLQHPVADLVDLRTEGHVVVAGGNAFAQVRHRRLDPSARPQRPAELDPRASRPAARSPRPTRRCASRTPPRARPAATARRGPPDSPTSAATPRWRGRARCASRTPAPPPSPAPS